MRRQVSLRDAPVRDIERGNEFWMLMKEQGIYGCPDRWFLSIVHTDQDIDRALAAADRVMEQL